MDGVEVKVRYLAPSCRVGTAQICCVNLARLAKRRGRKHFIKTVNYYHCDARKTHRLLGTFQTHLLLGVGLCGWQQAGRSMWMRISRPTNRPAEDAPPQFPFPLTPLGSPHADAVPVHAWLHSEEGVRAGIRWSAKRNAERLVGYRIRYVSASYLNFYGPSTCTT